MTKSIKISCRNLWKVFGANGDRFMARHGNRPTDAAMLNEGFVGALRDVSFDVYAGEILVIKGLSGSGKSTLIRAITRLNDPDCGEVLLDGKDLLQSSIKELTDLRRHKLGMVFQHFGLLPHRVAIENVAFPLEIQCMDRATRLRKAGEILQLVDLEGKEHHFSHELSGGQQQRAGIARSLAVEPESGFWTSPSQRSIR